MALDLRDCRLNVASDKYTHDTDITKSDVIKYYIDMKLGQKETAKKLGIDYRYLLKLLKEYSIEINHSKNNHIYDNEKIINFNDDCWMIEQYDENGRSISDIAKELKMSSKTIKRRITGLGIPVRKQSKSNFNKELRLKLDDREFLKKMNYENGMNIKEISQMLDTDVKNIAKAFKKLNIPLKVFHHKNKETLKKLLDSEWMYEKYIVDELSPMDISVLLECTAETVKTYLKKDGIQLRSYDDSMCLNLRKCKKSKFEIETERVLNTMNVQYIPQFSLGFGPADFYLIEYDIILECDGTYWHSTEKAKTRDVIKTKKFKDAGYHVYRIPEERVRIRTKPFYSESKLVKEIIYAMEVYYEYGSS